MLKVQTGQIVEFYSNSCCVVSEGKELRCKIQGRINLVVGDLVQLELSSMDGNSEGLVTKRLDRVTVLYKSKEKVKKPIAANISHIGILVTKNPKTNLEFIDKWITISKIASIEPFIIFNKIDLLENSSFLEDQKVYERIGIKTFQISAKFFIKKGIGVYALDLQGHGKSEGKRGHIKSFEEYLDSVESSLIFIRKKFLETPIILFGHSLGGLIGLNFLIERESKEIESAVISSPWIETAIKVPEYLILLQKVLKIFEVLSIYEM